METGVSMHGHRLVAVYPSRSEANLVREKLIDKGVSPTDIRISDAEVPSPAGPGQTPGAAPPSSMVPSPAGPGQTPREDNRGFWAWLLGDDVPDYDRPHYERHFGQDRAIVSVYARTEEIHRTASNIMLDSGPLVLDDQAAADLGVSRAASNLRANPVTGDTRVGVAHDSREKEEVIPVVKEELHAGKRVTEDHRRLRVYTVSKPVEDTVMLRDETVTVERRPATGAAGSVSPQDRTIDVTTRHEEAVAEKRGTVAEEVVVRREVTEHPETVRGTVQETRVEEDRGTNPTKPVDTPNRRP